jgi:hypothetical protein
VKRIALAALVTSLVVAVGLAPTVLAQSGVGTVRGSVTDAQGGSFGRATHDDQRGHCLFPKPED